MWKNTVGKSARGFFVRMTTIFWPNHRHKNEIMTKILLRATFSAISSLGCSRSTTFLLLNQIPLTGFTITMRIWWWWQYYEYDDYEGGLMMLSKLKLELSFRIFYWNVLSLKEHDTFLRQKPLILLTRLSVYCLILITILFCW